jgi:hypothetical protein
MIAPESHVYTYYIYGTKGNMQRAADRNGISRRVFAHRVSVFGIDYRKFRGAMCSCRSGNPRCEVCKKRNRKAATAAYQERKLNPTMEVVHRSQPDTPLKVMRMLAISDRMTAMQRFLQLSK